MAQAVRLLVAKHARSHGVKSILTHNGSQNEAMLRVNEKLGFVKRSERIEFEKVLQDCWGLLPCRGLPRLGCRFGRVTSTEPG